MRLDDEATAAGLERLRQALRARSATAAVRTIAALPSVAMDRIAMLVTADRKELALLSSCVDEVATLVRRIETASLRPTTSNLHDMIEVALRDEDYVRVAALAVVRALRTGVVRAKK